MVGFDYGNYKKRMPTLEEHNETIRSSHPLGAGVSCPKHPDIEMVYVNGPTIVNLSHPATQTVQCPTCFYIGYKRV